MVVRRVLFRSFRDRLGANGAVNAVVSKRIYWGVGPQGAALPYVRLHIISDPRPEHLKGYQGSRRTRIQVSIFAKSFKDAKRIGSNIVKSVNAPWSTPDGKVGRVKCEEIGRAHVRTQVINATLDCRPLQQKHTIT